jgi:hypothetical protein
MLRHFTILFTCALLLLIGGNGRISRAQQAAVDRVPTVTYSSWDGGCQVGKIGGITCTMFREARSTTGQRLGVLVYGEEERSRFLFVGAERPNLTKAPAFSVEIGSSVQADGKLDCEDAAPDCSAVITVDDRVLKDLMAEGQLIVNDRDHPVLRFPLAGFTRARAVLL